MSKAEDAKKMFLDGANCAQAVLATFANECEISPELAMKMASGFGAGMGRMREVCGAVSGMFLVANLKYGYHDIFADNHKSCKDATYDMIQDLGERFKKEAGSIICRELLQLPKAQKDSPVSEERSTQYYTRRPCAEMVRIAAEITAQFLAEKEASQ